MIVDKIIELTVEIIIYMPLSYRFFRRYTAPSLYEALIFFCRNI